MLIDKDHRKAFTSGPLETNYKLVDQLCSYIAENWQCQPSLDVMASALGYSPAHIQKTFSNWAGISPKEFIHALNINEARKMLERGETLFNTSHDIGLSTPSRLHDLFVQKHAMTPGAYKMRGKGLLLHYGFVDTLFGTGLFIYHGDCLAGLSFCDADTQDDALADMQARWPKAQFKENMVSITAKTKNLFSGRNRDEPLKIVLIGTDFDISVWEALTTIPKGSAVSYSNLAHNIGKPKAVRAIASAVGRNPISFFVPCHRVLRRDGMLGGYHWGLSRKCAILGWEKTA